jgi:hypothetical protein
MHNMTTYVTFLDASEPHHWMYETNCSCGWIAYTSAPSHYEASRHAEQDHAERLLAAEAYASALADGRI